MALVSRHDRAAPDSAFPGRGANRATAGRCSTPRTDRSVNETVSAKKITMRTIQSRDEVDSLTDPQKDAYARMVLADARLRRRLESRARSYLGTQIIPVTLCLLGLGLAIWTPSLEWIAIIGLLALARALQWQAHGLNRRLDAVVELLDYYEDRASEAARGAGIKPAGEQGPEPNQDGDDQPQTAP